MLDLPHSWLKSSNTSLFYNKALNIACDLFDPILKVKTRMVAWVQNDCKYISLPWWLCGYSLLPLPSSMKEYLNLLCITSMEKRLKFKIWSMAPTEYISFCTLIKLKNRCQTSINWGPSVLFGSKKINEVLIHATTWKNLENGMLSERTQHDSI